MNRFTKSMCVIGVALLSLSVVSSSFATTAFSDNFNSYTAGANLSGQGPWTATAAALTPMQVTNIATGDNAVRLGTSGQDEFAALTSGTVTPGDGNSFYFSLSLNVISAQATGDYFMHDSTPAGTTTAFFDRLHIKSTTGGFLLGIVETSGGAVVSYGTGVLTLGTTYQVVVARHFVAGALNDTLAVYVNPTDTSVELNNTAYVTKAWTSTTAENTAVSALNLRQGTAANAPAEVVDNILASTTFADVTIPEPSTVVLVGLGLVGLLGIRRRRS